jgi:2-polyprenyl-3-methyl-5-hydroxy-6-metoxy-1,4-benzoquinol methylase
MNIDREKKRLESVGKWYHSFNDFDSNLIRFSGKEILENIGKNKKVLEVGCASGVMTKMLATRCTSLTVVDGNKHYIGQAKSFVRKRNVKFIISLIEDFEPKEKYDVIIVASLLEHVKYPKRVLRHVTKLLAKNGQIHITVPNAHSLHRRIGKAMGLIKNLQEFSKRDKMLKHRRLYNKATLTRDVISSRLKIVSCKGIFLKPLSNQQMESFPKRMLEAFYKVGKTTPPEFCSELYICCEK